MKHNKPKTLNKADIIVIEEFRKYMRDWRHAKNISQAEAAELLGVEVATISRYESVKGYPKISNIYNWLTQYSALTNGTATNLIDRLDRAVKQQNADNKKGLDSLFLHDVSDFPFPLQIKFKNFCEMRQKCKKSFEKKFSFFIDLFDLPEEKIDILRIIVTSWVIDAHKYKSAKRRLDKIEATCTEKTESKRE